MSDTQAMEWLDRLLDLQGVEREDALQTICRDNPALHARLVHLLAAAEAVESSQIVGQPVIEALRTSGHATTSPLASGQSVAGYRLIQELGRGGMSVVWLAERVDGVIKRSVAMKLPLFVVTSQTEIERFMREKDVLAGLTHPNIARLYDAGITATGQPFITLEYVDGMAITSYCDRQRLNVRERLQLFLQVLAAVDHAHKHLVVHRDLKPSNILVDAQGQTKLLDFGIAKLLDDPTSALQLTQLGSAALTPLYCAPEQVTSGPISIFTDVYVLGLLLHELLTGRLPFPTNEGNAPSLAQVMAVLSRDSPTRPSDNVIDDGTANNEVAIARRVPSARRLKSLLQGDLDTIVCKAMQLHPTQRYSSVESFAEDVRRYLANIPIAARAPGIAHAGKLFLKRNRNASLAAGIGIALFGVAATIALHQYRESRANETRTAAIRNFMFDLVNDVQPSESQLQAGTPITAKQMLDGAVVRARREFAKQPRLQGELFGELGRMYGRLGERDIATQLLNESIPLLEASAPQSDPSLNKARAHRAQSLLDANDLEQAKQWASQAHSSCTQTNIDCAKARAYANTVLSQIASYEGQSEESLSAMRAAVRDTALAFGEHDKETAVALTGLAVLARNAGHLQEASDAMDRALQAAANQSMAIADRNDMVQNMAVLDLDMGRYEAARTHLTGLLEQSLPPSDRALHLRLLANVLNAIGDPEAALAKAEAAIALRSALPLEAELFFARQARAQSLALLDKPEAQTEMQTVIAGLRSVGRADNSAAALRARRISSEVHLRLGHTQQAHDELQSVVKALRSVTGNRDLELGLALDLLGCALRELHNNAAAQAAHDEARLYLQNQLPTDHPFLLRNTLYREATTEHREGFARAAARTKRDLAPKSIWRDLIDTQLDRTLCQTAQRSSCILVL